MRSFFREHVRRCRAWMVVAILMGTAVQATAQFGTPVDVTPAVGAPAWKTEVIQFEPRHGLRFQQAPEDLEPARAWERFLHLPAPDASEREVIAHIQKQTAMAKRLLNDSGFNLPSGTAILWDNDTGTLAVRSTHEVVEWLKVLGSESRRKVARNVSNTLRVIQADGAVLREIARETTTQFGHTPAWQKLEKFIAEGKATHIQTLTLNTRSGQRGDAQIGSRSEHIEAVVFDERGMVKVTKAESSVGTELETDHIVFVDDYHVDANLSMSHHFAESVSHEVSAGRVLSKEVTLPAMDDYYAQVTTTFSVLSGSQTLLGVWKPTAPKDLALKDVLQAAFLETRVVRDLPEVNPRVLPLLSAHMDEAEPVPVESNRPARLPAGMRTIRMSVPPYFLSPGGSSQSSENPPDPFAPQDPAKVEEKPSNRTAVDVLKEQGISFPEGAMALFEQTSNTLTITNTQENLGLVESYFSGVCYCGPANIQIDVEILEADGALIRAIAEESAKIADHAKLLERLDQATRAGQVRHVGMLRAVARSGQRMLAQSGAVHVTGASVEPVTEKQEESRAGNDGAAGEKKPAPDVDANPRTAEKAAIKVAMEEQFVGTRMELDGLISPDGVTLEMELAIEHHYSPPTRVKDEATKSAEGSSAIRVMKSAELLHYASVSSLFTMRSGSTRLFGMWKPEGAPEYDGKDVMQVAFVRAAITRAE